MSIRSIYITDLAPNKNKIASVRENLEALIKQGVKVTWLDHHLWEEDWIRDLSNTGARIIVDTSTCATGVVRKNFLPNDPFANELEKVICSIDLWRFDDPRAPFFTRLVSYEDTDKWRRQITNKIITAERVDDIIKWGMRQISEAVDGELKEYNYYLSRYVIKEICGIKFVILVKKNKSFIGTSQLAHYMLSITNSDIAVIVRRNGSVSFRSREFNVRDLAVELGGGGHKLASGASVRLDLISKLLVKLGYERILIDKVVNALQKIFETKYLCKDL
jgi:oligoribonuclease NrnB/cAMP/cGMP phosphodiesterase (DHH superfamily)